MSAVLVSPTDVPDDICQCILVEDKYEFFGIYLDLLAGPSIHVVMWCPALIVSWSSVEVWHGRRKCVSSCFERNGTHSRISFSSPSLRIDAQMTCQSAGRREALDCTMCSKATTLEGCFSHH